MLLTEDAYGRAKRQLFVEAAVRESKPRSVLDFGCGTGSQLTWPLAEAHPDVTFLGIDSDDGTIDWARRQPMLANLTYSTELDAAKDKTFDMVIASEVMEHVEEPDDLLAFLRSHLSDDGRLIVTVPNGYGPFEWASFVEHVFTLIGVLPLLRAMKHAVLGKPKLDSTQALTLAVSPHLNFFSMKELLSLFRNAGFELMRYKPRTVICGFAIEWAIRGPLIDWNARVADQVPAWCASDWMFVCKKTTPPAVRARWRRNWWARFRRLLSERRWAGVSLAHQ